MSFEKAKQYAQCIEPLTSQECFSQLPIVSYPHMKPASRKKIEKDLRDRTKRAVDKKPTQGSTEDIYHHLIRTLGNG